MEPCSMKINGPSLAVTNATEPSSGSLLIRYTGDHNDARLMEDARICWLIGKLLQDPAKRERIIAFIDVKEADKWNSINCNKRH